MNTFNRRRVLRQIQSGNSRHCASQFPLVVSGKARAVDDLERQIASNAVYEHGNRACAFPYVHESLHAARVDTPATQRFPIGACGRRRNRAALNPGLRHCSRPDPAVVTRRAEFGPEPSLTCDGQHIRGRGTCFEVSH